MRSQSAVGRSSAALAGCRAPAILQGLQGVGGAGDVERRGHGGGIARGLDHHTGTGAAGEFTHLIPGGTRGRVNGVGGAHPQPQLAPVRGRLHQDHAGAHGRSRRSGAQTDGPAAEHGHRVARLGAPDGTQGVIGATERLHGGALLPVQLVGQPVTPVLAHLEELRGGSADGEPEVVAAAVDCALAHDPVAGTEAAHLGANLDHLARPLVAGDDGEAHRHDAIARQQVEVGVADTHLPERHEHLVRPDPRLVDIADLRHARLREDRRLHPGHPLDSAGLIAAALLVRPSAG